MSFGWNFTKKKLVLGRKKMRKRAGRWVKFRQTETTRTNVVNTISCFSTNLWILNIWGWLKHWVYHSNFITWMTRVSHRQCSCRELPKTLQAPQDTQGRRMGPCKAKALLARGGHGWPRGITEKWPKMTEELGLFLALTAFPEIEKRITLPQSAAFTPV